MNRYMESIVKGLGKYGGDIIKFVGDAMIVVWPRDENDEDDDLASVARKAIKVRVKDKVYSAPLRSKLSLTANKS